MKPWNLRSNVAILMLEYITFNIDDSLFVYGVR